MNIALKEYLSADNAIDALVHGRIYNAKIDQTAMFPKIAIRLIDSSPKEATLNKVSSHKTFMYQIECQGGYDLSGTDKAQLDAIDVAKAVEDRLADLHEAVPLKIGTTVARQVQVKHIRITDSRESQVEMDPTTNPTAGAEILYTYYITLQATFAYDS